jgi:hypothetical protein
MTCTGCFSSFAGYELRNGLCIGCLASRLSETEATLSHATTSMDEGCLPWWQHKHDEMLLKWAKAVKGEELAFQALDKIRKDGASMTAWEITLQAIDAVEKIKELHESH